MGSKKLCMQSLRDIVPSWLTRQYEDDTRRRELERPPMPMEQVLQQQLQDQQNRLVSLQDNLNSALQNRDMSNADRFRDDIRHTLQSINATNNAMGALGLVSAPQSPQTPQAPLTPMQAISIDKNKEIRDAIIKKALTEPKFFHGKLLQVLSCDDDSVFPYVLKVIVLKVQGKTEKTLRFTCSGMLQNVDLLYSLTVSQLHFTREIIQAIDPSLVKTIITQEVVAALAKKRAEERKLDKERLAIAEKNTKSYAQKIKQLKGQEEQTIKLLATAQRDYEARKKALETSKPKPFTAKELQKEVETLKKHPDVEDVYLTEKNNIMIITKHLYATDDVTNRKDPNKDLGAYAIKINPKADQVPDALKMMNLTYRIADRESNIHYHSPHIKFERNSNHICWGDNQNEILQMLRFGQLYPLIDFVILFCSIYPQKFGSPYIGYADWLTHRIEEGRDIYHFMENPI